MTPTREAGWYVCYSASGTRRWHYFNADQLRSRCGQASGFQRTQDVTGEAHYTPQLSSVALTVAGFCHSCDRTRRKEEGR
jgi:hypothetical protein